MIADVSAPDLETRIAIIESKCQEKGFTLANNIVTLIATTVQSNIRELEGALNKVIAFHELKNIAPSEETVRGMLSTFASQQTKKVANPQDVLNVIMSHYGISEADLKGKSREKRLSFPRQIAMFLLREEMKLSYPAIGQELGGRDHTTAMHAHTKISKKIEEDPKLKEDIELLLQRINNPQ
jgi:chromosomal replication initiator protein